MSGIFLEAESFENLGGWLIDQQSVLQMGSPYLMAHGLGKPVQDASTEFSVSHAGTYTVFVRTRDWTSPWSDAAVGRFSVKINQTELPQTLGVRGERWGWQKAGTLFLEEGKHRIYLHDLTGFNGRCDAIYLTDGDDVPPDGEKELAALRNAYVCPQAEEDDTVYDLIVVGGGIAGVCTALAASRSGCNVLLVHDREVLGGCNSSEVRVCLGGQIHLPPYEKLGNVVKEIAPVMGDPTLFAKELYEDDRKRFAFMQESKGRCRLALCEQVVSLKQKDGAIDSVESLHIRTGKRKIYRGKLFSDCTGDAVLARLCGAELMYGREAKTTFGESLGGENYEKLVMGQSLRWYSEERENEVSFPEFKASRIQSEDSCLHVKNGDWEQEAGFRRDMADETEYIRDYGLLMIYGNWSYQKNFSSKKADYAHSELKWISHFGGKRESYRVVGGYILTQNDIENFVVHEDATASMTWSIDIHFPECTNEEKFGEAFRSFAYHRGIVKPYAVPYRCLYARDVNNLFLGGRTVSTSHVAFSAVRVMRTLGMLGEVVGLAASVCKNRDCLPADVYSSYLEDLKELMKRGVPSPDAFACGCGSEESYHFKDAGWVNAGQKAWKEGPFKDKIEKNLQKLGIDHKYKDAF